MPLVQRSIRFVLFSSILWVRLKETFLLKYFHEMGTSCFKISLLLFVRIWLAFQLCPENVVESEVAQDEPKGNKTDLKGRMTHTFTSPFDNKIFVVPELKQRVHKCSVERVLDYAD